MTEIEAGRLLAENWAEWLRRDDSRLGYPRKTPIGRLQERSGVMDDIEDRIDKAEAQMPVDESMAEMVERRLIELAPCHREVLLAFYAEKDPHGFYRRLMIERPRSFSERLDLALVVLARACEERTCRPSKKRLIFFPGTVAP